MKITTQGNGIKIGPRLEDKIASKMSKFDKYFGDEGTLNVRIRPEGAKMVIEITMKLDGKIYRAEARDEDILTGVDKTVDKLESQIRRQSSLRKRRTIPESSTSLRTTAALTSTLKMSPRTRSRSASSSLCAR